MEEQNLFKHIKLTNSLKIFLNLPKTVSFAMLSEMDLVPSKEN